MRAPRPILKLIGQLSMVVTPSLPASEAHESIHPGRWYDLPAVGTGPVQEHGVAATNDDLYIVGGISANVSTPVPPSRSDISAYNFNTSSWRSVTPIPLGMTHANAAAVDGKIYVLGGLTGNDYDPIWQYTADCFMYDPDTDEWAHLPSMPDYQGRGASAIGVYKSTVYLAGGMRSNYLVPGGLQDSVDIVTAYDTHTGEWTTLPSLPGRRDHVGGAVIGSTFFVVGGRDHGHDNKKNTTWAMDLNAPEDGWTAKAEMPTARAGMATGVIGRFIVTFGGEGNREDPSGVFAQAEAYDTQDDRWTELSEMLVPRHGMAAASVRDSVFIAGGGLVEGGDEPIDIFTSFTL
ncbi:hypothetical protein F4777DRAFT_484394 [Nemania sp. FL0916]|nr:hypothetical protein F4777DRAFT_484394 [Nemania sp. FL0916]